MEEPPDKKKPHNALNPKIINFIALIVTLVWAGSFIADISTITYNPPPQIHTVMLSIVGSIFGFQIVGRSK